MTRNTFAIGLVKEARWVGGSGNGSFSIWVKTGQNGRESLGETIYKNITVDSFDPGQFLSTMDLSTELTVLDLKNKIEASIVIWKRKMNQKDTKSAWSSSIISSEKRELFEDRAETILLLLKQQFPGLPQSTLEISKIESNKV
ncbi:putative PRONE domain, Rop guanine nucleotide exchange factor [Helianthus annuus]|nr:putative PRONE domain, Rop guanine nucleotide exchange factor [Helianthus annuus]